MGLVEESQIHRFPGETSEVRKAVEVYRTELENVSVGVVHVPILGVGPDGHVGSLFPRRPELLANEEPFLFVEDSPKPPSKRVTISPRVIRESHYPFLFFLGEEKRVAYECFEKEGVTFRDCPCRLALSGSRGKCYAVTDLD
jgi:6-phosphogluconolactonase